MKTIKDFLKEEGEGGSASNSAVGGAIGGLPPDDPPSPRFGRGVRIKKKKKKKKKKN